MEDALGRDGRRFRLAADPSDLALVRSELEASGWQETDGEDWTLRWFSGMPGSAQYERLSQDQFLNHLPGIAALASKDGLATLASKLARRLAVRGAAETPATPRTFLMPEDYDALQVFAFEHPESAWIQKPRAAARGEGVALVDDVRWVETRPNWLVQEYLLDPHLIDGFKYTLRCYALITCLDPLTLHIFDDSFTKLASRPFSAEASLRSDRFRHLTNPDVLARDASVAVSQRNLTRQAYGELLQAEGHDPDALFATISEMSVALVAGAREGLARAARERGGRTQRCFELLGLDVLVDEQLHPWLLECNLSPSLSVEADPSTAAARAEAALKRRLLASLFEVIGVRERTGGCGFDQVLPAREPPAALALARPSELPAGAGQSMALRQSPDVRSWPIDDSLVLHLESTGEAHMLNPLAGYIWTAWSDGLSPDAVVAEIVDEFPDAAASAGADVWNALGQWVEHGLAIPDGEPPPVSEVEVPSAAPVLAWNRQRVYRALGCRVSILTPDVETQRWVDVALAGWDCVEGCEVAAAIEVRREEGIWTVIGPGARIPCVSQRQLGPCVRELVLKVAADAAGGGAVRGTIVGWSAASALLTGPSGARAELARACIDAGGRCVADDLVAFTVDGDGRPALESHLVTLEEKVETYWYGPLPGHEDPDGALTVTRDGAFSRYWRPPTIDQSPTLVRPVVSIAITRGRTGSPFAPVPVDGAQGLGDLLSARVRGVTRVSAATLDAAIGWIAATRCFRTPAGEPARAAAVLRALLAEAPSAP